MISTTAKADLQQQIDNITKQINNIEEQLKRHGEYIRCLNQGLLIKKEMKK